MMKRLTLSVLVMMSVGCDSESSTKYTSTDSGYSTESHADSDVVADSLTPTEKWYGLDSDQDSIVYEKDGVVLTSGIIHGSYVRMERHEFMHYVIADSNGYLHRFFLNTEDQRQMDKYFEGYEPARGHPVTVKWIRGQLALGKNGEKVTVYQAKEVIE